MKNEDNTGMTRWWSWLWSPQRIAISNAELLQLRLFQVGSVLGGAIHVVASLADQIAGLFR